MYLSGNPKNKTEAARWVRMGIELTVLSLQTARPILQKDGTVDVTGNGWVAKAMLKNGIVIKLT